MSRAGGENPKVKCSARQFLPSRRRVPIFRAVPRVLSSLLLACWAWALALAGLPELHAWAHGAPCAAVAAECGHDSHHDDEGDAPSDPGCAATLLATGAVTISHAAPVLTAVPMIFAEVVWGARHREVGSLVLVGEPLERGPPTVG